ncbi:ParA family protein [Vibrio parahaemolyticus]|uniref:ParA family protein n=1 Tax=Vibrio parahaemolyticus TaxID=670 RepID=UPI001120EA4E|nr:AAA family ATPase [Vibrio parahaemolyticus]TOE56206.1 ATPase [Vibrio parahaemolyticus]HCG8707690.1 AAA family ATPase [Vibrio parahaemolyticus]
MSSYVLWANKGGIGKSTLTFQLACTYARENADKKVVVIDLSPQCDVSRMILGGGHFDGESKILDIMLSPDRKTIFQYLRHCARDVPTGFGWPNITDFITIPNDVRSEDCIGLPNNLNLICGDFDLERITSIIEQMPESEGRGGFVESGSHYSKQLLSRTFLKKAIADLKNEYDDVTIFVDTDPYYSVITTHIGLLAADKWITAYSPSSQASQYAVYRSLEFLHNPRDSLKHLISASETAHPKPWFDQRDQEIKVPDVSVPQLAFVFSNMTTSKASKGEPRYSQPQALHRQTISRVDEEINSILKKLNVDKPYDHDHIWSLQRLGLICDYNGIDISSITVGNKYPQPDLENHYSMSKSQDSRLQVEAYTRRLNEVAAKL